MRESDAKARSGWWEDLLLLGVISFYAFVLPLSRQLFNPGFVKVDEESTIEQIQVWREGGALDFRFARSSIHRLLAALLVGAGGPHLFWVRFPAEAGALAEAVLLYYWLKGKLGERAAVWACLSVMVCTGTYAIAGSMVAVSIMPALFLLHALASERVRRSWQAAAWGATASLCLLDYEGWACALAFLLPYSFCLWGPGWRLRLSGLGGVLAGSGMVWWMSRDISQIVQTRIIIGNLHPSLGMLWMIRYNLLGLLGQNFRISFSAAPFHSWPAPWTWPLALAGAYGAVRRFPWLAWLLVSGSLALGFRGTDHEPHRMCLMLLAVGAFAGVGAVLAFRTPWGRILCVGLFLVGVADEVRAWVRTPELCVYLPYGTSIQLENAAAWLAEHPVPGGWEIIDGLGASGDGAFRFLLDLNGVGRKGKVPVALVYRAFWPGLRDMRPRMPDVVFGKEQGVRLFFPAAGDAARLRRISGTLRTLRSVQMLRSQGELEAWTGQWLRTSGERDPWIRSIVWTRWIMASTALEHVDIGGVRQMVSETLVSGGPYEIAGSFIGSTNPPAARLCEKAAEAVDPGRKSIPMDVRIEMF